MVKPKDNNNTKHPSSTNQTKVFRAHQKLEKDLLMRPQVFKQVKSAKSGTKEYGFENIIGVGISEKLVSNSFTGQMAVTVFVIKKASKGEILKECFIPEKVLGIQTDVMEIGEIHALANVGRYRPAPGGVSVGHFQITAGTLGCIVKKNGQTFILSNNHVLANSNNASINDPILQPGPFDGGQTSTDTIARLSEYVPVQFNNAPNFIDAAIARSSSPLITPQIKSIGTISANITQPSLFQIVKKSGRTTELTRGLVTAVNVTIRVSYGTQGTALFQNQFIIAGVPFIAPFSQPGDSGSLIITEFGNNPVGLLFAGSSLVTIANPIQAVLSAFQVTIAT